MFCNACGTLPAVSTDGVLTQKARRVRFCYVCGSPLHVDSRKCVDDVSVPPPLLSRAPPANPFFYDAVRSSLCRRLLLGESGAVICCLPTSAHTAGGYSDISPLSNQTHSTSSSYHNEPQKAPLSAWPVKTLNKEEAQQMISSHTESFVNSTEPQLFVRLHEVESVLEDLVLELNSLLASMHANCSNVTNKGGQHVQQFKDDSYDQSVREITLEKRINQLEREMRQREEEHKHEIAAIHREYKNSHQLRRQLDDEDQGDVKAAYLLLRKTLIQPTNSSMR